MPLKPAHVAAAGDPQKLSAYLRKLPRPMHHGHGAAETVREAEHNGHRIVIRTTYRVAVDGRDLAVPLAVDNDGNVHCHSLPNYQFVSAVDMVKQLIDSFPRDFGRGGRGGRGGGHGAHDHMSMRTTIKSRRIRRKTRGK